MPRDAAVAPRRSHAERGTAREGTRERLVRAGIVAALERGWAASGVDAVLCSAGVPKGSFYHYFDSKDAFGEAVIDGYQAYFLHRLERCFGAGAQGRPIGVQLDDFLALSAEGMARHGWLRGCLVGALGQELAGLHEGFRERLLASLTQSTKMTTSAAIAAPRGADWSYDQQIQGCPAQGGDDYQYCNIKPEDHPDIGSGDHIRHQKDTGGHKQDSQDEIVRQENRE